MKINSLALHRISADQEEIVRQPNIEVNKGYEWIVSQGENLNG